MQGRIKQLDYVRAAAMVAVVVIHCSSTYVYADSSVTFLGMNLALWLNKLTRFAVPMFVLLSGVSLAVSPPASCRKFVRGRMKITVHYCIWTAVYYLFYLKLGWMQVLPLHEFGRRLLFGGMDVHLYFVPLIVQMYILYYPLCAAVKKAPALTLASSLLVTVYFQLALLTNGRGVLLPPAVLVNAWMLFPTWIFYFVLGLWLSRERLENIIGFAARSALPLCAAAFLCGAACSVVTGRAGKLLESFSPWVIIYTVTVFAALAGLATKVNYPPLDRAVRKLSDRSFTVYLSHIVVLQIIRLLHLPGMRGMLFLLAGTLLGSLILSVVYDKTFDCLKKAAKFHRFRSAAVGAGRETK